MSLLGSIGSGLKKAFKGVAKAALPGIGQALGGPVGGFLGSAVSSGIGPDGIRSGKKMRAQLGGAASFMPGGPSLSGGLSLFDPFTTEEGSVVDYLTPDALVRPVGRKRRRMNPLNARAARRAIRRIKAVRRITNDIERSLPKARSRAPARRRAC